MATSLAGEFFSRKTAFLRCWASCMSSRSSRASMIGRSPGEPTAMMLLVRRSTENRSGTSDDSPSADGDLRPARADLRRQSVRSIVIRALASPLSMRKTLIWATAPGRVELADQGGQQVHALGGGGHDQGIQPRVGRDPHVVEDPRLEQPLALGIDGEQFQGGRFLARRRRRPARRRWPLAAWRTRRWPACSAA